MSSKKKSTRVIVLGVSNRIHKTPIELAAEWCYYHCTLLYNGKKPTKKTALKLIIKGFCKDELVKNGLFLHPGFVK